MTCKKKANATGMMVLAMIASFVFAGVVVAGQVGGTPPSYQQNSLPLSVIPTLTTDPLDVNALLEEDLWREEQGLPVRFALAQEVKISPESDGRWEDLPDGSRLWRLRVSHPGAKNLNLGFTHFDLPHGARLFLYAADGNDSILVFSSDDNRVHQQLWTPVLTTDEIVVELVVSEGETITEKNLTLGVVGRGYRDFGRELDKAGSCNIDVVCAEGDLWQDEIRSEAVYSFLSDIDFTLCSGAMINNTQQDSSPLFLTAFHCGVTSGQAPSVVVYWNYQSENCGDLGGGSRDQFTTGSTLRATYATTDMTLIELDASPDPAFGVTYAGWDRSTTLPDSVVAIHSPQANEKCISFEYDPTSASSYSMDESPGDETHIRVEDWDLGTTEPGSSGSPLFNLRHRIVGQLHGGFAACGNNEPDWYGRLAISWDGGGDAASRLSDWLDPLGTGALVVDTYDPLATGLGVTPLAGFVSSGDTGGPFTPTTYNYTLANRGGESIDFAATTEVDWITISPSTGSISAGGTVGVTVSLIAATDTMSSGLYRGSINFENTTAGEGNTTREVELTVGQRELAANYNMDQNPGWSMQGDWAWGIPTGAGGEYGGPDPTAGSTGSHVLGYNLTGDYSNNMDAYHLQTGVINFTGLTGVRLRFKRWLGVESSQYDHASLSISTNGTQFDNVWANSLEITDSQWVEVQYDISEWADGNANVILRWTMGDTDVTRTYCGWNIDDVQLWAFGGTVVEPEPEHTGKVDILSVSPNPFSSSVQVVYYSDSDASVSARVFNIQGAMVADLGSSMAAVGENILSWDGRTGDGRRLASGLYIIEIYSARDQDRMKVLYVH